MRVLTGEVPQSDGLLRCFRSYVMAWLAHIESIILEFSEDKNVHILTG